MYERALWKDEVVVSFNERALSPIGEVWVWAYGLVAYFPHFASYHTLALAHRFQDEPIFGRTGRGPLARRTRVKCECEDGKLCLQVFLSIFWPHELLSIHRTVAQYPNRFWMNGTYWLDERAEGR
jgi:hypothetical protein